MIITPSDYTFINESGKFYLEGKGTEANVKNGNSRVYPPIILENAFNELKREVDKGKKIYSNLEHPKHADPILTKDSVGRVVDMHWVKSMNIGNVKIELDPTLPKGEEIIRRYQSGEMMGVSHRARGALDESGVVTAMKMYTFDVTVIPSCKTCILNLSESENTLQLAEIEEYFEVIGEDMSDMKDIKREYILQAFREMLRG